MSKNSASRIASRFDGMRTFVKCAQQMGHRHSIWQVFQDFCAISAISISNAVMPNQERENEYLSIVKRYTKEELEMFAQMLADLVNSLEVQAQDAPADILGPVFHELELHNKWHGQFFSPQHICDLMGAVTCPADKEAAKAEIERIGHYEICEPCAGSGAMIFGFARAMKGIDLNYCSDMCVTATDIDIKCVHMAYIQLSLYGIPAVVIHGNTLTLEEWSHWYTPVYVMNLWDIRRNMRRGQSALTVPANETVKAPVANNERKYAVKENGQLSMF